MGSWRLFQEFYTAWRSQGLGFPCMRTENNSTGSPSDNTTYITSVIGGHWNTACWCRQWNCQVTAWPKSRKYDSGICSRVTEWISPTIGSGGEFTRETLLWNSGRPSSDDIGPGRLSKDSCIDLMAAKSHRSSSKTPTLSWIMRSMKLRGRSKPCDVESQDAKSIISAKSSATHCPPATKYKRGKCPRRWSTWSQTHCEICSTNRMYSDELKSVDACTTNVKSSITSRRMRSSKRYTKRVLGRSSEWINNHLNKVSNSAEKRYSGSFARYIKVSICGIELQ